MTDKLKVYYCKPCLMPYRDGLCLACNQPLVRNMSADEELYKRAAMTVLRNHRSEFFAAVEAEKDNDY